MGQWCIRIFKVQGTVVTYVDSLHLWRTIFYCYAWSSTDQSISWHLGCNGGKLTAGNHETVLKPQPTNASGTDHVLHPRQARVQKHSPWRRYCEHHFEWCIYVLHCVQIIQIQARLTCSFATATHIVCQSGVNICFYICVQTYMSDTSSFYNHHIVYTYSTYLSLSLSIHPIYFYVSLCY